MMKLVRATDADNQKLIEYYKETPVPGRIDVQLVKKHDYFSQYKIQSDDFVTFMLLNSEKNNTIEAMASLIFRRAWVDGEEQTVGYATDLRVSPHRKAILEWSQHFLPILKEESEKRNCEHIFSIVAQSQSQAYNAFIRPRSTRRQLPRYFMFRRFNLIGLHGRYPFSPEPLTSIETRHATDQDLDALAAFVAKQNKKKPLSFNSTPEAFVENLERWKDLCINDFLLAIDRQSNIVGCTALWRPSLIEEMVPLNYDSKTLTLKEALHFFSYFGFCRRLPPIGTPMSYFNLSFLLAENPDIFYSLLVKAYNSVGKDDFLLYSHFEGDLLTIPPPSFIHSRVRMAMYCIVPPEANAPGFLKPRVFSDAPDFDLSFI